MVSSFSNTKLRVPKGFQSLLVGLTTEILRSQPRNIPAFAADYFEKLLQRREQGQAYVSDKQTTLEDRYYNNQSFQEEYPVNNPDVNDAAIKIQAQFRGYKARRDLEKLKQENKPMIDFDQPEEQSTSFNDQYQKLSFDNQQSEEDLTEEEKREQERAAIAIQAQFRGFQVRKNLRDPFGNPNDQEQQQQEFDKTPTPSSIHFNDQQLTAYDEIEAGENDEIDRPHLEPESTQLSEDFERHTQITRDPNLHREQQGDIFDVDDDMNDPHLEKAATRIQASYRGYKTRKELGSGTGGNYSNTGQDEYDNSRNKNILSPSAEGNKVPAGEDDDNAAAVKIQAAYRGYRVRKDLEK